MQSNSKIVTSTKYIDVNPLSITFLGTARHFLGYYSRGKKYKSGANVIKGLKRKNISYLNETIQKLK